MLLPETDAAGAAIVAERLGAAVRDTPIPVQPHSVGGVTPAGPALIPVTVSIGIAVYPGPRRHRAGGARRRRRRALRGQGRRRRDTYRHGGAGARSGRRGRPITRRHAGSRRDGRQPPADAAGPDAGGRAGRRVFWSTPAAIRAVADSLATCRSTQRTPQRPPPVVSARSRPSSRPPVWPPGSCRPPRRCPRSCCRSSTGRSSSTSSRRPPPAGIGDVLLITGRGKTSMVDHFDRRPDLEARLEEKGDAERLAAVRGPSELAEIYTCRQPEQLGLGHAVGCTPSRTSATSPSRCCSATSSSSRPSRCCRRCWTCRPAPAASCWPSSRSTPAETKRYGIASVEPDRRRSSPRSARWSR